MKNRFEVVSNIGRVMGRYESRKEAQEEADRMNNDLEGCGLAEGLFLWVTDLEEDREEYVSAYSQAVMYEDPEKVAAWRASAGHYEFPAYDEPGGLEERWDMAWREGL